MRRTFEELKRMLESKKLLYKAIQKGEEYDIYGIAIKGFESEPYNKLVVLRPETTYATYLFEGRVSFLIQTQSLDPSVGKGLMEKEILGGPLQVLMVTDIDAAETAVQEFFNGEPASTPALKEKKREPKEVSEPKQTATVLKKVSEPKQQEAEKKETTAAQRPSCCPVCGGALHWLPAVGRDKDFGGGAWHCRTCGRKVW